MKIPKYAHSIEFSGFSMRIEETWQRKKQVAEEIDGVDEAQTKKLQEIPIGTKGQLDHQPDIENLVEQEHESVVQETSQEATHAKQEKEEYLLLHKEKQKLFEENPDVGRREKDVKLRIKQIQDRMRYIESKSQEQSNEKVSSEEIILEKEEKAGRKLNVKEREYLELKLERQKILEKPAKERSNEENKRYTAIKNRMKKLQPDVIIDFL